MLFVLLVAYRLVHVRCQTTLADPSSSAGSDTTPTDTFTDTSTGYSPVSTLQTNTDSQSSVSSDATQETETNPTASVAARDSTTVTLAIDDSTTMRLNTDSSRASGASLGTATADTATETATNTPSKVTDDSTGASVDQTAQTATVDNNQSTFSGTNSIGTASPVTDNDVSTSYGNIQTEVTTGSPTVSPVVTNTPRTPIRLTFSFRIVLNLSLSEINFNSNRTISGLLNLMEASFSRSVIFKIIIVRYNLLPISRQRASENYELQVTSDIISQNDSCTRDCIVNSVTKPNVTDVTFETNDGKTEVTRIDALPSVVTDPPTINVKPASNVPAQLGMGLGISFFGIIVIAEIVFLYWRFMYRPKKTRRDPYRVNSF